MKNSTTRSQKIGWLVFTLGGLYMFGSGWGFTLFGQLKSHQARAMVPDLNQV